MTRRFTAIAVAAILLFLQTAPAAALSESRKIEALINHVRGMTDAAFIRNGREHDAAEAAEHLRRKWRVAGDHCRTAETFIQNCASRSSLTGISYKIRLPNGMVVPTGRYLRDRLADISGHPKQ
jgi:hypothetical protein